MTRYARAKGSKASNERLPEEPTPWHVMQQQMLNKDHQSLESNRVPTSSTTELKKKNITAKEAVAEHKFVTWASFKRSLHDTDGAESIIKKQRLCTQETDVSVNADDKTVNRHVTGEKVGKRKNVNSELAKSVRKVMQRDKKPSQIKVEPTWHKNEINVGLKTNKINNYQGRMADNSDDFIMYCNGQQVKVVHYDGFLIKEKDAEELSKLKVQLIAKGVPRDEYQAVLKLERRKAEKTLARLRKSVCYKCRKSGHNFSQCPEKESDDTFGYCFKCGSTEHTHFQCKVIRGEEYRYAHCFLCKEQGHIAKQCPDNPRGLYPRGGACHLCADVTHYVKDCPQNIEEKEKNTVTVETFNKNLVEALDEELHSKPKTKKFSKNKVVNF